MSRRGSGSKAGSSRLSLQVILLIVSFSLIFIGKIDLYTVRATKSTISELVAPIYDIVAAPVRPELLLFIVVKLEVSSVSRRSALLALAVRVPEDKPPSPPLPW